MEGMAELGVEPETPLPPGPVCALSSFPLLPPPGLCLLPLILHAFLKVTCWDP